MQTGLIPYSFLRFRWRVLIIGFLVTQIIAGCKKPTDPDLWLLGNPNYKGWLVESYKNVRVYYSPGHPQAATMLETAKKNEMAWRSISQTLEMPPPTDTFRLVYYTGVGQGEQLTGHFYAYADSLGVGRFWLPCAPGIPVAQALIRRWSPTFPVHKFLWHGLVSLFDFRGRNYHEATIDFTRDSLFIPLAKLAVDTSVDSDVERHQSAEAASFCAYIIGVYGVARLKLLYDSRLPFDLALQKITGKSVDEVQKEWLEYATLGAPKYNNTTQRDTLKK